MNEMDTSIETKRLLIRKVTLAIQQQNSIMLTMDIDQMSAKLL